MGDFEGMKNDSEMEIFGPLRVLLVEPDDSTRNIIAALLRKCSYQVTTVSDGLRAWETLKGRPETTDLILTEVELPSISGYALLTLIMEHDICKNIPVIMMSPKDSISISLKCMSRGAADFLIKPVRKNELRNLWQHVWRRQTGQHQIIIESACRLSNTRRHQENNQKLTALKSDAKAIMANSEVGAASCHENGILGVREPYKLHVCGISKVKDVEVESENHTQNVYINEQNHEVSDSPTEATDLIGKFVTSPQTYMHVSANDIAESPFTKLELSLRRSNTSGLEDAMSEDIVSLNHSKDSAFSRYENSKLRQTSPIFSGNLALKHGNRSAYHDRFDNQENTNSFCLQECLELELSDTRLGFTTPSRVKLANKVTYIDHSYALENYPRSDLSSDCSLKSQHENNSSIQSSSEVQNLNQGFQPVHDIPSKKDCSMDFHKDDNGVDHKLSLKRCRSISCASEVNNTEASGDFSKATLSESVNDNNVLASDGSRETSSHHNSQREAALYKFRLKRKDRCYEKKVRYQSRKKLAEQRARVKGQFVRQDAI